MNYKFRGYTTKGARVEGSLVQTTHFIKHREKQHTKNWIVVSSFGNGGWFNIYERHYVRAETLGRISNAKDLNGVFIAEHDQIKVTLLSGSEIIGTVVDRFGSLTINRKSILLNYSSIEEMACCGYVSSVEIIGNKVDDELKANGKKVYRSTMELFRSEFKDWSVKREEKPRGNNAN
jgi:hypothetical protein